MRLSNAKMRKNAGNLRFFCVHIVLYALRGGGGRKGCIPLQEEKQPAMDRFMFGEPSANILAETGISLCHTFTEKHIL